MKKLTTLLFVFVLVSTFESCKVSYGFTQPTSIQADTFQVNYFQNNSALIEPGLDRDFKIALEEEILNQTSYDLVTSNGDLVFEGEITEYRISPTTATANNTAAQNRLTISVNVRFYNTNKSEDDLEQRFSFFYDYAGSSQLTGSIKETAHEEIFERLTQDIINATLAKW